MAVVITSAYIWQFWKGQAAFMRARGIEYHCISSEGPQLDRLAQSEGAVAHPIELTRTLTPGHDLCAVFRLAAKFREIGAQIVEGDMSKAGLLAMIAAWLARVPVRIYRNHGMALCSAHGAQRTLLWWCERISCLLANEVIYVAPSVRDAAVQNGVCPLHKAKVVLSANGLDTAIRFNPANVEAGTRDKVRERCGIPADALVVGFVGRLFRVKGIVELVQSWETLAVTYSNLHLLVAGEFDIRDPIPKSIVERLRNSAHIHMAGHVDDTPSLLTAMDVLALPSFHEGLGYTLIEASAMGLPVVGTRIPGILDAVLDGVTGTLVEPGDTNALAEALRRYLDDPGLRRRHGQAGRRYVVENFQQQRVWNELYSLYENLALRKGVLGPTLTRNANTGCAT
jgi:glycosyltransferase involved in cell wall biosynthesis